MASVSRGRWRAHGLNGSQGFDGWQEVNMWLLFIVRPSPGTHTHTHTYIQSDWVEMDQRWNAVNHGPIQSEGGQAWKRPSHMWKADLGTGADAAKTTRPRDTNAAGGSHEDGERKDFCLDTDEKTGEIRVNSLTFLSHTLWESHTLHALHPPPRHPPPCNKECEWKPTWTKWRRKTCWDQT